jgi:hypothetical protein
VLLPYAAVDELTPTPEYVPPRKYTVSPGLTKLAALAIDRNGVNSDVPLLVVSLPEVEM